MASGGGRNKEVPPALRFSGTATATGVSKSRTAAAQLIIDMVFQLLCEVQAKPPGVPARAPATRPLENACKLHQDAESCQRSAATGATPPRSPKTRPALREAVHRPGKKGEIGLIISKQQSCWSVWPQEEIQDFSLASVAGSDSWPQRSAMQARTRQTPLRDLADCPKEPCELGRGKLPHHSSCSHQWCWWTLQDPLATEQRSRQRRSLTDAKAGRLLPLPSESPAIRRAVRAKDGMF